MLVVYAICAVVILFAMSSLFYFDTVDTEDGMVWFLGLPFLGAVAAFGFGVYSWMKHGEWSALSTAEALHKLGISSDTIAQTSGWIGIDRLAHWIAGLNVGWTLLTVGFVLFFSAAHWSEKGATARHIKHLKEAADRDVED